MPRIHIYIGENEQAGSEVWKTPNLQLKSRSLLRVYPGRILDACVGATVDGRV